MVYNEASQGFEVFDEGVKIGEVTWSIGGKILIIEHTFVSPDYRGQGIAEELVFNAVAKARREGYKIMPLCPFAKKEFEQKSEYGDVLYVSAGQ